MNTTIELLRLINPTGLSATNVKGEHDYPKLLNYAQKNRIALLFLDHLKETGAFTEFSDMYDFQTSKYFATFEAVDKVSSLLSGLHIDHAVFKTVRPYIFNTVDIDAIIFGGKLHYEKANDAMGKAGYRKIVRGPMSTTFEDLKMKIGIDVYNEVAVSFVPYIDKNKLEDFVIDKELPGLRRLKTLACEADLLSIIAHSIIKENLYVLSEYYTCIHYLDVLDVDRFVELVKKTHLTFAAMVHMSITAWLYKTAHGELPQKLKLILQEIGTDPVETRRIEQNHFKMPHRYHTLTVARCLLQVTGEVKTVKGLARQAANSIHREFLLDFLKKLREHTVRETY